MFGEMLTECLMDVMSTSRQRETAASSAASCESEISNWSKQHLSELCTKSDWTNCQSQRSASSARSVSDWSDVDPAGFTSGDVPCEVQLNRPVSPSCSYVSMKSKLEPPEFSCGAQHSEQILNGPVSPSCSYMSMKSKLEPPEFSCGAQPLETMQLCTVTVTKELQQELNQPVSETQFKVFEGHKSRMKNKYESLYEVVQTQETRTLLNRIYTQLYIIEGESEGVNEEHEVIRMEKTPRKHLQDTPINCNDIFKSSLRPEENRDGELRMVMTKGIAGIGKTVSVQKFILDWAEEKANQDVDLMFVLPFRELNLIKDDQYSLHKLLCDFHPELKDLDPNIYNEIKAVFIFDGLDESRLPLNFSHCEKVSDITMTSSVDVLMTNLIRGDLLPSALIWITSRPAAANQIPPKYINRVTEIQGFNDPQKEEYFRKRINDQEQAQKIISHIKTTKSLHIMCHIPVFCWILATVLQQIIQQHHTEIPKTLTEMYIHFLLIQTHMKKQKFGEISESRDQHNRAVILKLAELAFTQLMRGNVMFYEEDLRESSIDIAEASVYSGFCTEIFKEESVLYHKKIFCFVHLSFQEFLAAFYVFFCYTSKKMETLLFFKPAYKQHKDWTEKLTLEELLEGAVRRALRSPNGNLDLFLRFLLGISLESNQKLLEDLLINTHHSSDSVSKIITHIQKQIKGEDEEELERISAMMKILEKMMERMRQRQCLSADRCINLFLCLTEMKDQSLSSEIQEYLIQEQLSEDRLSPGQCSALACMLLLSEEVLDQFILKKYKTTQEGYRRLMPAVSNCRKAQLAGCNLTSDLCNILTSALQSLNCPVTDLDLSNNDLQDSGVELISAGLKSPHCKLEILRLAGCNLTKSSCETLSSILTSENSLKALDVGYNILKDAGVELLCAGLMSSHFKLETLRLAGCNLTTKSCETLTSALQSVNSHLRDLDLSNNDLQDSGVELISAGLKSPHCKLEILRLAGCGLSTHSCTSLCSSLTSENSPLKELNLNHNHLQDSGVKMICAGLQTSHCNLQILRLSGCLVTEEGCSFLDSALKLNPSRLKELDMNYNHIRDLGVKLLCVRLEDPLCKLQILRLAGCDLTKDSCETLASVLQSEHSVLRELDLSTNELQDSGLELISAGLSRTHCRLETLKLSGCLVTGEGCCFLASALKLNPSYVTELDLTYNNPEEPGVKLLSARLEDPNCRLQSLRMEHAGKIRINPGLRKYGCDLTLDPDTVHVDLVLSDRNRTVRSVREQQDYPDHADRFTVWLQVLCRESVCGRCYWEADWTGRGAALAVTYRGINRKGGGDDCRFGYNSKSWRLYCTNSAGSSSYSVWHNKHITDLPAPPLSSSRVGVYLDWRAGLLSFYSVCSHTHTLTHMYTFHSEFTEPLYAGFWIGFDSSVSLC